jgi:hypothetical protein
MLCGSKTGYYRLPGTVHFLQWHVDPAKKISICFGGNGAKTRRRREEVRIADLLQVKVYF